MFELIGAIILSAIFIIFGLILFLAERKSYNELKKEK